MESVSTVGAASPVIAPLLDGAYAVSASDAPRMQPTRRRDRAPGLQVQIAAVASKHGYKRGACRFFNTRGYCARGEQCLYHHIKSQLMHARYTVDRRRPEDILVELEGTPALVVARTGTVRFLPGVPREWGYFRAMNVVLRAVGLRVVYEGSVGEEWRVMSKHAPGQPTGAVISAQSDTVISAFEPCSFGEMQNAFERLPQYIEVAKVPDPRPEQRR